MKILIRTCALLGALTLGAPLPAQAIPDARPTGRPTVEQTMDTALRVRSDLVTTVATGERTPEAALDQLRITAAVSGLRIDPDADLALAAVDIGQRLIAVGKPDKAEKFFTEAEKSLDKAVKKTPDSAARDKAQYLRNISFIRGRYLNKVAQAKADIEQAIALQPEDLGLRREKDVLANEQAEHFKDKPKG